MSSTSVANEPDVIVIGSGMGGMTTAAALSRLKHKVLLVEQAQTIGGLTHTFSRNGFSWDVGLHYCGTFGKDQPAGRVLGWLSGGAIEFRSVGTVYDTLHFPGGFEIAVARPATAYKMELKERFPDSVAGIDAYFEALQSAVAAAHLVAVERAMPEPFRSAHRWWNKKKIQRWCGRTTGEVIADITTDPKLAAVLSAQWGTYGGNPQESSFGVHATVMSHYLDGAGYPVGGAAVIARSLVPVIEAAGGSARASTPVSEILVREGKAIGVRTSSGEVLKAPVIVSAIGARETVKRLLPQEVRDQEWAREVADFRPSICHFQIFLGFEGDIARHGATRANHWFYESEDTNDGIWSAVTDDPIPMTFVSFPSLKNAAHDPGSSNKHTGDVMVFADWSSVAEFADGGAEERADEWAAFKQDVEAKLMGFFTAKFPALAPLVVYRELGTPLATRVIYWARQGRALRRRDDPAPHAVGRASTTNARPRAVLVGPGRDDARHRWSPLGRHARRCGGRPRVSSRNLPLDTATVSSTVRPWRDRPHDTQLNVMSFDRVEYRGPTASSTTCTWAFFSRPFASREFFAMRCSIGRREATDRDALAVSPPSAATPTANTHPTVGKISRLPARMIPPGAWSCQRPTRIVYRAARRASSHSPHCKHARSDITPTCDDPDEYQRHQRQNPNRRASASTPSTPTAASSW